MAEKALAEAQKRRRRCAIARARTRAPALFDQKAVLASTIRHLGGGGPPVNVVFSPVTAATFIKISSRALRLLRINNLLQRRRNSPLC